MTMMTLESREGNSVVVVVVCSGYAHGHEQGWRAEVRATEAMAQRAQWCALYDCFCTLARQGWECGGGCCGHGRCVWRRASTRVCEGVVIVLCVEEGEDMSA